MLYSSDSRTVTKKIQKKCNSPGEFPGLVVFLAVFFRKFDKKIAKCNSLTTLTFSDKLALKIMLENIF